MCGQITKSLQFLMSSIALAIGSMSPATVIHVPGDQPSISVPKAALIHEGDLVRVWVVHEDRSIELRQIETGIANGDLVEVKGNLMPGELIVTKGSLFIDRRSGS